MTKRIIQNRKTGEIMSNDGVWIKNTSKARKAIEDQSEFFYNADIFTNIDDCTAIDEDSTEIELIIAFTD